MTGGPGSDVFFLISGSGQDTITDYEPGQDSLSFYKDPESQCTGTYVHLRDHGTQEGANVVFQLSALHPDLPMAAGDTLTLRDLTVADLYNDNSSAYLC